MCFHTIFCASEMFSPVWDELQASISQCPVHTVAPSGPVFNYLCITSQLPSTISLRQTHYLIEMGFCFTACHSQAVFSATSTVSELKKLWRQSSITTSKKTSTRSQSICGDYPRLPRVQVCFLVEVISDSILDYSNWLSPASKNRTRASHHSRGKGARREVCSWGTQGL